MGVGICGASGTGKTTLAKAVAKTANIKYVASVTRSVYEELGLSVQEDYDLKTRLMIQNAILDKSEQQFISSRGMFITDRTPIDFAAYVLADVRRSNMSEDEEEGVKLYLERCIRSCNMHFQSIIVCQPGIQFVKEHGRTHGEMYNEHVNFLMIGIMSDQRIMTGKHILNRNVLDLKCRITSVLKIMSITNKIEANQMGILGTH